MMPVKRREWSAAADRTCKRGTMAEKDKRGFHTVEQPDMEDCEKNLDPDIHYFTGVGRGWDFSGIEAL